MPLNRAARGAGLSKDASFSRPRVLLASLESDCDYHGRGRGGRGLSGTTRPRQRMGSCGLAIGEAQWG